jgi:hypothetical protein
MERKNRIPITRLSRYYDEVDFDLELDMAREVIEEDANFTVVLYRIDKTNSNNDDVYGESESREIRFEAPVELKVLINLQEAENKSYAENGSLRYQEYGNLVFTVLNKQLVDKGVDISYGDIIGYSDRESNLKYFEVFNDGKINSDNLHTQFGYKSYFRTISCVVVDPNQFNGI